MSRVIDILRKVRERGVPWLRDRVSEELRTPSTPFGVALANVLRPISNFVSRVRGMLEGRLSAEFNAPALVLVYDLALAPVTFDLAWTLVDGEMERRRRGLERLDVVFVPGYDEGLRDEGEEYETVVSREARRWRVDHILVPMCRFVPSIGSISIAYDRSSAAAILRGYGSNVWPRGYNTAVPLAAPRSARVLALAEAGVDVRVFDAGAEARRHARAWIDAHCGGMRTVVITLRDYAYKPARNSNFEAWGAFARALPDGWRAVFVPDTEHAMAPPASLAGMLFCCEAAWNLAFRLGLYEEADLNMAVSGGPMNLCWFDARARYAMVKIVTEGVWQASPEYLAKVGHEIGAQPPFVREGQSWVWEEDELSVLQEVFARMRRPSGDAPERAAPPKVARNCAEAATDSC
jgi:hypothetical protein